MVEQMSFVAYLGPLPPAHSFQRLSLIATDRWLYWHLEIPNLAAVPVYLGTTDEKAYNALMRTTFTNVIVTLLDWFQNVSLPSGQDHPSLLEVVSIVARRKSNCVLDVTNESTKRYLDILGYLIEAEQELLSTHPVTGVPLSLQEAYLNACLFLYYRQALDKAIIKLLGKQRNEPIRATDENLHNYNYKQAVQHCVKSQGLKESRLRAVDQQTHPKTLVNGHSGEPKAQQFLEWSFPGLPSFQQSSYETRCFGSSVYLTRSDTPMDDNPPSLQPGLRKDELALDNFKLNRSRFYLPPDLSLPITIPHTKFKPISLQSLMRASPTRSDHSSLFERQSLALEDEQESFQIQPRSDMEKSRKKIEEFTLTEDELKLLRLADIGTGQQDRRSPPLEITTERSQQKQVQTLSEVEMNPLQAAHGDKHSMMQTKFQVYGTTADSKQRRTRGPSWTDEERDLLVSLIGMAPNKRASYGFDWEWVVNELNKAIFDVNRRRDVTACKNKWSNLKLGSKAASIAHP